MKDYVKFEAWMLCGAPENTFGDETEYPIAGCRELLSRLTAEVTADEPEKILCVGPGCEQIAAELYADGCDVWIANERIEKLEFLSRQMPKAHYMHCDIFDLLPEVVYEEYFDAIVCTYIMHTAGGDERLWTVEELLSMLSEDGRLYIGDVCFWTSAEREICRRRCHENWDTLAHYLVYDDFRRHFAEESSRFIRVSHCAGIIVLTDGDIDDSIMF